jgi:hypothetical protein
MSKKKNTLGDLEEFLKMQASTLVNPPKLAEKVGATETTPPKKETVEAVPSYANAEQQAREALLRISAADKKAFYDLLVQVTESLPNRSAEDVMLINTALYLKGGANWKETVRQYWRGKTS